MKLNDRSLVPLVLRTVLASLPGSKFRPRKDMKVSYSCTVTKVAEPLQNCFKDLVVWGWLRSRLVPQMPLPPKIQFNVNGSGSKNASHLVKTE